MNLFDMNLAALSRVDPDLASALRNAGGGALCLSQARNGLPTASRLQRPIHSLYDPASEASAWAESIAPDCRPGEMIVVLGVGLLYQVEALREIIPRDAPLAVAVPDLRELHDACQVRDCSGWIGSIRWVYGEASRMAERLSEAGHRIRVVTYAPAAQHHAEAHKAVEALLRARLARQAGGQLHVAVVGPLYGGSLPIARYTVSALERLGHRVSWIDHSVHASSYDAMAALADPRHRLLLESRLADLLGQVTLARLAEDPPDLVLALAQAPLALPLLEHLRRKRFLTAIWFVENFRHLTYWQQVAAGYDYWFVIQRDACEAALRRAGARDVSYLPVAADPGVHRPVVLSPDERNRYGAQVSFVGAGYPNRRAILPTLIGGPWTVKVWGNEWEGAGALTAVLQGNGQRIDTDACVKVFNSSTINLNLHSYTGPGLDPEADFVNPRTFELAACGAFQLVDRRALLPELFTELEVATFEAPEHLGTAVARWLDDEPGRRRLTEAARRRVLAEHTYEHRLKALLAHVGMREPDRVGAVLHGERSAGTLLKAAGDEPELATLLKSHPPGERLELKQVAARIRTRGATRTLSREELLILLLDEYRGERRDLL
ncbi:CgeB family protein [Candidatus Nitrospira bockiana]